MQNKEETRGRKTVMTPEIIDKLEQAFLVGASDKEACLIAQIAMSTLYAYCQANKEFSERKEELKEMVKYKARKNISDAIDKGDKALSQWYLERKVKEEFAQRSEVTGKDGRDLIPDEQTRDKANNAIKQFIGTDTTGGEAN